MLQIVLIAQLWASTPSPDPRVQLAGSWQSCQQEDGSYGERIFDYCVLGRCQWALHMGPRDEFALYRAPGPDGEHTHDGEDNLLAPSYHVNDVRTWRGKRNWSVPSLHLWVSVVAAGGSYETCDSFYVLVRRAK
jgi:hypothetical protein